MCTVLELLCVLFSVKALNFPFDTHCSNEQLRNVLLLFGFQDKINVILNLYCPGHLSYFSPNESEPLHKYGIPALSSLPFIVWVLIATPDVTVSTSAFLACHQC